MRLAMPLAESSLSIWVRPTGSMGPRGGNPASWEAAGVGAGGRTHTHAICKWLCFESKAIPTGRERAQHSSLKPFIPWAARMLSI